MRLKEQLKYIYHSDIETLEIFQSALLILVNPINLYQARCVHHDDVEKYLITLGIACAITGILNLVYLFKKDLKQRLNISRLHLIVTLTICGFLAHCQGIEVNISLLIYYWIQTIACLFVSSRLYLEFKHKQRKVQHG